MKVTSFLLLAVIMIINGKGWAQVKLTLTVKNERLEKVFDAVERQTGYVFFFDEKILENARPVSINAVNMPLDQFLEAVLKDQSLRFSIRNTTITIAKTEQPLISPPEQSSAGNNNDVQPPPAELRGKVTNVNGEPLARATVTINATRRTVQCNSQGDFVLKIARSDDREVTLTVSFIGYETQSRVVRSDGKTTVVFRMQSNNNALDQVLVIAYGTSTRRYVVGSVTTVTAKEIERQPVNSSLEGVAGRVAGLTVTPGAGAPNSMMLAQVRGQNTIPRDFQGPVTSQEEYNQPLFLIDGVPFAPQNSNISNYASLLSLNSPIYKPYGAVGLSPLSSINPLDIESITVLKDADATAIYGSRGSNGVILINTKKARPGKLTTQVSVNSGPTMAGRKIKMMDTKQYLSMRNEALKNDGLTPSITPPFGFDFDILLFDSSRNVDWYDKLLGGTANRTDAHITLSGGSDNMTYLVGLGFTKTGFNYPGNFADQRYSLNSQLRVKSLNGKFTLNIGSLFTYQDNKNSNGLISYRVINTPPNFPEYTGNNGELLWSYNSIPFNDMVPSTNYYAGSHQPFRSETYNYVQSLNGSYTIIPGLTIGGIIGYNRFQAINYAALPIASQDPASNPIGTAVFEKINRTAINIEPQLNYSHTFGKFNLRVLIGGTWQKNINDYELLIGMNYPSDALLNSITGAGNIETGTSHIVDKYVAGFGRVTGIWDNRYILNLTGNINGSSLFGPGNRYGNFGSIGGGWIFSETKWIKRAVPVLSFGKLTANFGVTGSNNIPPYLYQSNWTLALPTSQYQGSSYYVPLNPLNPDFHWATKKDYNGRLSIGLFRDWLVIDLGIYRSRTDGQLLDSPIPMQTGFSMITSNAPFVLQNKGWEISISPGRNAVVDRKNKITLNAPVFNISMNRNKIVSMPENSAYKGIFHEGYPVTVSPFVKYAGVDPQTGSFQFYEADGRTLTNIPDIRSAYTYDGDATELIDFTPSLIFGIGDGFSWNGFTVNFFGHYVKQKGFNYLNDVYHGPSFAAPGSTSYNVPAIIAGKQWQKPGDNATIERFGTNVMSGQYLGYSTAVVGNASYFRLSNLEIRYDLNGKVLQKLGLKAGSVNLSCQNLFMITPYEVGDPSIQSFYGIPPQRVVAGGFNISF